MSHLARAVVAMLMLTAVALANPVDDWNASIEAGKKAYDEKKLDDAQKHFEQAVKIAEGLGDKDARLAGSLDHLGAVHSQKKEYTKAEPLFKRAIAIIEAARDKGHTDLIITLQNLATVYRETGRLDEAEAAYKRTQAIVEATFGKDDERVATALSNLAALEGLRNRHDKTAALLEQALTIREKKLGGESGAVAQTCADLGNTYFRLQKLDDAEKHYIRSLSIQKKLAPGKQAEYDALGRLAQLLEFRKKFVEALPVRQRMLEVLEANLGKDHAQVGVAAYLLGNTHAALEQNTEAEAMFQRALTLAEKAGANNIEAGKAAFSLGRLHAQAKQWDKAEPMCKKSIAIFQRNPGPSSPLYAVAVLNYAAVMEATGRKTEAQKLKDLVAALQKQTGKDKK